MPADFYGWLWIFGTIGPFISGISLAAAAAVTYYIGTVINERNKEEQRREVTRLDEEQKLANAKAEEERRREEERNATDTFRALYAQFWQNASVAKIRRCVVNDQEYATIAPVLSRRNAEYPESNNLCKSDNDVLEEIDQFCATLVRIRSYADHERMTPRQLDVWNKVLGNFWLERIKTERDEFHTYIKNHWPKDLLYEESIE
jgi:hypothetical protein